MIIFSKHLRSLICLGTMDQFKLSLIHLSTSLSDVLDIKYECKICMFILKTTILIVIQIYWDFYISTPFKNIYKYGRCITFISKRWNKLNARKMKISMFPAAPKTITPQYQRGMFSGGTWRPGIRRVCSTRNESFLTTKVMQ